MVKARKVAADEVVSNPHPSYQIALWHSQAGFGTMGDFHPGDDFFFRKLWAWIKAQDVTEDAVDGWILFVTPEMRAVMGDLDPKKPDADEHDHFHGVRVQVMRPPA